MNIAKNQTRILLAVLAMCLVLISVFMLSKGLKRENIIISDEDVNRLADNLIIFNYSEDKEDRLSRVSDLLDISAMSQLMNGSLKYNESASYSGTKSLEVKESSREVIRDSRTGNIMISINYVEMNRFSSKMTTMILIETGSVGIEEIAVYDLFDNADHNSNGL